MMHIGRQRNDALALYLVADSQAPPLGVHVLPAHRQHFTWARTGQQQRLQVGRYGGVADVAHGGEPCGKLLTQKRILLYTGLAQCLTGAAALGGVLCRHHGGILRMLCAPCQEGAQQAPGQAGRGRPGLGLL